MMASADTAPPCSRSAPHGPRLASVGIHPSPSGTNRASNSGMRLGLGDGAPLGARDEAGVLGERTRRVARLGHLPIRTPALELLVVHHEIDGARFCVDDDAVAVLDKGDGTAIDGL